MKRNFMLVLTLLLLVTFPIIAAAEERDEDNANKQKVLQEYDEAHLIALAAATCAGTYIPDGIASEYSYLGEYGFVIQPYTVNDGNREANSLIIKQSHKVKSCMCWLSEAALRSKTGKLILQRQKWHMAAPTLKNLPK